MCSLMSDLFWVAIYFLSHFNIHIHLVKRVVEATSKSVSWLETNSSLSTLTKSPRVKMTVLIKLWPSSVASLTP